MFKNYLVITLRNIKRNKSYSLINIIGLTIGIACCLMIFLWIMDELSFDQFHKNRDNLYRVIKTAKTSQQVSHIAKTPNPLGPALMADFPEVEQ